MTVRSPGSGARNGAGAALRTVVFRGDHWTSGRPTSVLVYEYPYPSRRCHAQATQSRQPARAGGAVWAGGATDAPLPARRYLARAGQGPGHAGQVGLAVHGGRQPGAARPDRGYWQRPARLPAGADRLRPHRRGPGRAAGLGPGTRRGADARTTPVQGGTVCACHGRSGRGDHAAPPTPDRVGGTAGRRTRPGWKPRRRRCPGCS